MKNWKTTTSGILTILTAVFSVILAILNDQTPDFSVLLTAITTGIGLMFARDAPAPAPQPTVDPVQPPVPK